MTDSHALPEVFLSHIAEEADLAAKFKAFIRSGFPGQVEVFVASDGQSIMMGDRWLEKISDSLGNCFAEIVLCSPMSISRPWVNIELGAAWARAKIPVIPCCHSGLRRDELPHPLSSLQAANADNPQHLLGILQTIAKRVAKPAVQVDCNAFTATVAAWQSEYTLWGRLDAAMRSFGPKFKARVAAGETWEWGVKEMDLADMKPALEVLQEVGLLTWRRGNHAVQQSADGGPISFVVELHIAPGPRRAELVGSKRYLHR